MAPDLGGRVTPAERARILAAIRADRLARGGRYVYDPEVARRCALASMALAQPDGGT